MTMKELERLADIYGIGVLALGALIIGLAAIVLMKL